MDSRVRIYPLLVVKPAFNEVQYRDFVFRRIFGCNQENGAQDILLNVRELCRLDTSYVPGNIAFPLRLTRSSVGCLSAVLLLRKF
jgi:hypothetical protein